MYLNDKNNNKYKYSILKTQNIIAILLEDAHFIVDIKEDNLYIKDVWVKPELRKNGIWSSLLNQMMITSKDYGFNVIISLGQFRRPIATRVWRKIPEKVLVKNQQSKKMDYYLYL